jgi:hypothetical protein
MIRSWPDLAKMAGIRPDLTGSRGVRPGSERIQRNQTGIRPNLLAGIRQGHWTLLDSGGNFIFTFVPFFFFSASQILKNIFEKIIFSEK